MTKLVQLTACMLAIFACSTQSTATGSKPIAVIGQPLPSPTPKPTTRKQVIRGWISEYEEFISQKVHDFPALFTIPQSEMQSFCPGWSKFSDKQKAEFYVDLLYSLTGPESGYNRYSSSLEASIGGKPKPIDSVTKYQVRSEGLLQLSYSDAKNYKSWDSRNYQYCPFDWAKDKPAFEAQLKDGVVRERTILDAYNNLGCSLFIMNFEILYGRPIKSGSWDFKESIHGYWAVINPKYGYARVRSAFVKRQPTCNIP